MAIENNNHEAERSAPRKIIFVRNLPFSTTSKQLEELFSDDAPIKQAFVVKDKDNHSKCRGFGYVHFVLQEDADKAVKTSKTVGDRKLILCYANKKPKHEKRKKEKSEKEGDVTLDVDKDDSEEIKKEEENENTGQVSDDKVKKEETKDKFTDNKTDLQRTIVLTGLTSKVKRKAFRVLCEKFGEVENIVYPVPERSEVTAFIRFKDYKSTIRAVQKLPGQKVKKSNALSAVLLTKEGKFPSKKSLDKSRLIIRNLNFKVEEDELRDCFSKFGKVLQVSIPTKTVNKKQVKIGCGFIQFENPANGKLALEAMNMKEIKGRTVIVDWAVKKEEYVSKNAKTLEESGKQKKRETKEMKKKQDNEELPDENDKDDGEQSEGEQSEEGEEEEISDDEESGEHDVSDEDEIGSEGEQEDISDGVSDEEEDDGDDSLDEDKTNDKEREARMKEKLKDAKEGKTIFIRNMSYNTDDETLIEEFEKHGEVEYCRIVMDKETGHSKGCAFLKFMEKDAADKCVKEYEAKQAENKHLVVDGRSLVVSKAVTRGKMSEIERQKAAEKKETDKRNLYLALEGVITRKTPGAEKLSEADLKHREKALAEKKAKLKNPQYFVSRTRLCIRNLPLTCSVDELKKVFLKYSGNDSLKINDVKIMRSTDRKDESGVPRSLGFGFIEIDSHENALKLLRATNNNPEIFGEKRRLIVDFAVENSKALKILEAKKRKLDQMKSQREGNLETGFNVAKHRAYKQKAGEKRHKRNLRYQKKREEKRKSREVNETAQRKNIKQPPKKIDEKKSSIKEKRMVKKPIAKTAGNQRKRQAKEAETFLSDGPSRKRTRKVNTSQKRNEESKFENLVSKYKNKLNSSTGEKKKDGDRWFE